MLPLALVNKTKIKRMNSSVGLLEVGQVHVFSGNILQSKPNSALFHAN